MSSRRSSADTEASLAATAMALLAVPGQQVRLHVSGDFLSSEDGDLDSGYVSGLQDLAGVHKNTFGQGVMGWVYTQVREPSLGVALRPSGWAVLQSDDGRREDFDAIVVDPEEEAKGLGAVVCPQQKGKVASCADCLMCTAIGLKVKTLKPVAFLRH